MLQGNFRRCTAHWPQHLKHLAPGLLFNMMQVLSSPTPPTRFSACCCLLWTRTQGLIHIKGLLTRCCQGFTKNHAAISTSLLPYLLGITSTASCSSSVPCFSIGTTSYDGAARLTIQ